MLEIALGVFLGLFVVPIVAVISLHLLVGVLYLPSVIVEEWRKETEVQKTIEPTKWEEVIVKIVKIVVVALIVANIIVILFK